MPNYGNPTHKPMAQNDHMEDGSFYDIMDKVCSKLASGSVWHERSALYMCDSALRGFGRVHFEKAKCDHDKRLMLEKLIVDRLDHIPEIDMEWVAKAAHYSFPGAQGLKEHLHMWHKNKTHYAEILKEAVKKSATEDMKIYAYLCECLDDVQEEIFRVKTIIDRLELGGWNGHDLARVSKDLHRHHADGKPGMDYELS